MIESIDPFQHCQFDRFAAGPGSPVNLFGLVQAVDRLGQRIVGGLAIVSGLLLSFSCFATSIVDRDVRSILEGAKTVLEGKVIGIKAECDKSRCSSEVTIAVQKTYKGDEKATEARFCSSAPLGIGFSYIFLVETAQSEVDKPHCSSVVERDAVFSRFGDAVYRYMSPGSFNTAKIDADEYLTGWILVKEFDAKVLKKK